MDIHYENREKWIVFLKSFLLKGDLVQGLSEAVWDRPSPDDSKGHHMDHQAERGDATITSIQKKALVLNIDNWNYYKLITGDCQHVCQLHMQRL